MLPVLILVVPPTAAGGSYGCWYMGQQTALSLFRPSAGRRITDVPSQTTGSYIAGLAALAGTFALQSSQFHRLENTATTTANSTKKRIPASKAYVPPHKQAHSHQFQPPKTMGEFFQKMGRPVLIRAGAGGIAFFCSGMVQTLITIRND